jgi:hypothetical protein
MKPKVTRYDVKLVSITTGLATTIARGLTRRQADKLYTKNVGLGGLCGVKVKREPCR